MWLLTSYSCRPGQSQVAEVIYAEQTAGRSEEQSLPPNPLAPASSPKRNLVYAQVSVRQTQVPPPPNDDNPVQYAQLKGQWHQLYLHIAICDIIIDSLHFPALKDELHALYSHLFMTLSENTDQERYP